MLTSPIKPPLPSPSPPPLSAPAPFSLPASQSPCRFPRNLPEPTPASIVVPLAIALRPQYCLPLSQYWSCFSYLRSLSKNSRRTGTAPPVACCQQEPLMLRYMTFYEGGPHKSVSPRSSVLIRTFILPDRSCVKSYVNV